MDNAIPHEKPFGIPLIITLQHTLHFNQFICSLYYILLFLYCFQYTNEKPTHVAVDAQAHVLQHVHTPVVTQHHHHLHHHFHHHLFFHHHHLDLQVLTVQWVFQVQWDQMVQKVLLVIQVHPDLQAHQVKQVHQPVQEEEMVHQVLPDHQDTKVHQVIQVCWVHSDLQDPQDNQHQLDHHHHARQSAHTPVLELVHNHAVMAARRRMEYRTYERYLID